MKTAKRVVKGQYFAGYITAVLVERSQWFAVMPLPDDEWEIEVREENAKRLNNIPAPSITHKVEDGEVRVFVPKDGDATGGNRFDLAFHFTEEGLTVDSVANGEVVGSRAEEYGEIEDSLGEEGS